LGERVDQCEPDSIKFVPDSIDEFCPSIDFVFLSIDDDTKSFNCDGTYHA